MNKMYREKKEKLKSSKANAILDKYGGQEHMEQLAPELMYAQTEQYVEYDRSGGVKRGAEKALTLTLTRTRTRTRTLALI